MDAFQSEELSNDSSATGIIFNIQRYSIHDGPGIRTTVFLKGCPLRCAWCSNPESQKTIPEVVHRDSSCLKCGTCSKACDKDAISVHDKGIVINRELCNNCGECVDVCVSGSLKFYGEKKATGEIYQEVLKDIDFYQSSGGGVTVSGGEPLTQPDFVESLFRLCHTNDIHTCIETCGAVSPSAFNQILDYTSLVLFDIKFSDSNEHLKWTKKTNEHILHNLKLVSESGVHLIVRIPLIPGINDSDDQLKGIAGIVQDTIQGKTEINILPYHKFGLGKYLMLDKRYQLEDLQSQTEDMMIEKKRLFDSYGFECEIEM